MNRAFGMMPSKEVEVRKAYDTGNGLIARIDAGKNGWTIMYADYSTEYQDVVSTTEANLAEALVTLKSHFSTLVEVVETKKSESMSER